VTLNEWKKADEDKDGFCWDDGLFKKTVCDDLEESGQQLVVPAGYRQQLLKLAHDYNGHLSTNKIRAVLRQLVTWPGIQNCDICQREARARAPRTPMEEIPIMTVHFEKIAVDLVGPFQR